MAIRLDPELLQSYAQKLMSNSQQMQELAASIATNIGNAADQWEGKSRERFLNDYQSVKTTLDKTVPEMLKTMSENLASMAKNIAEADAAGG